MADFNEPQSRNEAILQNILGADNVLLSPQSRVESILQSILYDSSYSDEPKSRIEEMLLAIKNGTSYEKERLSRNEKILYEILNGGEYNDEPKSRIEELLIQWLESSNNNLIQMIPENIVVGSYINNSGVISSSTQNFYYSAYIPVMPNAEYVLEVSEPLSYVSFMEYSDDKTFIKRTLYGAAKPSLETVNIITGADAAFLLFGSNMYYKDITIEEILEVNWKLYKGVL